MDGRNERLEELLSAAERPLADAGFTEGVMRSLPARRFGARRARQLTLTAAAAIGSALTLVLASPVETLLVGVVAPGGLAMELITAGAAVALFAGPIAWVIYAESKN
jgi:hypothetical protein